jgi:hypothetical protein
VTTTSPSVRPIRKDINLLFSIITTQLEQENGFFSGEKEYFSNESGYKSQLECKLSPLCTMLVQPQFS